MKFPCPDMRKGDVLPTNENPPRLVTILGRSAMDPNYMVAEVPGRDAVVWIFPTGYCPDLGQNVFIGRP